MTFEVSTTEDTVNEENEIFYATLEMPTSGTLMTSTAVVTILDNDGKQLCIPVLDPELLLQLKVDSFSVLS